MITASLSISEKVIKPMKMKHFQIKNRNIDIPT